MPTIEVRFENLEAEAEVRVGSSGLPTVLNSIVNTIEVCALAIAPISEIPYAYRINTFLMNH
jgi:hypothetical protein